MKKLRFVVSLITDDNDYQREQAAAALDAAARLVLEVQTLFADNDAINQSQQLLRIIQTADAHVDAILVEPASRTCFPRVAQAAVAAGIGWGALNCEPDYLRELHSPSYPKSAPVFAVSADNGQVGRIQGRQLAAILPKGGSVLYILGPSGSAATEQRAAGMYESKPENVKIKVLKSGNWTEDGGYQAVASWLRLSTSHKEQVDAVQAQNDFLARGGNEGNSGTDHRRRKDDQVAPALARRGWASQDRPGMGATAFVDCDGHCPSDHGDRSRSRRCRHPQRDATTRAYAGAA